MPTTDNLINEGIKLFEEKRYNEAIEKFNQALESITDKTTQIQQQINAEHWIGYCYFEQARQFKSPDLFNKALEYFQNILNLTEKLQRNKTQWKTQWEIITYHSIGICYLTQAIQTRQSDLFSKAFIYFKKVQNLVKTLPDGKDKILAKKIANKYIVYCHINNPIGNQEKNKKLFKKYFNFKKDLILFHLKNNLKGHIASILAVLSISPFEFNKPLAHYTSPNVCEKLLGIDRNKSSEDNDKNKTPPSSMRMNSSAYMNDPYEGKSLTEFLGVQDISLENRTLLAEKNAYFSCFSSRVNDLNQFRLYGKVDNIEASGCCLVFNKNGNWIKEPDIRASYAKLSRSNNLDRNVKQEGIGNLSSDNLPLYQIAYIFYRDDYITTDEYDVLNKNKQKQFGIRLKPISSNNKWEALRRKKLAEALTNLKEYFQDKKRSHSPDDQLALEYIRYLFKDYAFRDEEEFRLLKIEEIGSKEVKYCPATNATYIEYGTICQQLDEVILGTNYEYTKDSLKAEVFRHLLKQQYPHIQVSHSSLPIAVATRKKG